MLLSPVIVMRSGKLGNLNFPYVRAVKANISRMKKNKQFLLSFSMLEIKCIHEIMEKHPGNVDYQTKFVFLA